MRLECGRWTGLNAETWRCKSGPVGQGSASERASVPARMEADVGGTFEAGQDFNSRLRDTILALIKESKETQRGVEEVRESQEKVARDQEALRLAVEKEKGERMDKMAVLEDRLEREKRAREEDVRNINKGQEKEREEVRKGLATLEEQSREEIEGMKKQVGDVEANLQAGVQAEKQARAEIVKETRDENEARKGEIAELRRQGDAERDAREKERLELESRVKEAEENQKRKEGEMEAKALKREKEAVESLDNLRVKMEKENRVLKLLAARTNCVYFDAYR